MSPRITQLFSTPDNPTTWVQLLAWAQQKTILIALDGQHQGQPADVYTQYQALLGVGVYSEFQCGVQDALPQLQDYATRTSDWLFGWLSYELKNGLEPLQSATARGVEFPDLYFFQPLKCFALTQAGIQCMYMPHVAHEMEADWAAIVQQPLPQGQAIASVWKGRLSRETYVDQVKALQAHIQRGDIYEVNFCTEFYTQAQQLDTLSLWLRMLEQAQAPFSAWVKWHDKELLCSSPERFLQKQGHRLISQPIKGTARRHADPVIDQAAAAALVADPKERAENTMIIDLVRNDLSKVAMPHTVTLTDGWALHSFGRVHQLISTISCQLKPTAGLSDILQAAFPMGSMTGAPKIRALELIDAYEPIRRGLFSGSVGYIDPQGDFDLNVVIRSLLYDAATQYVSCPVGSAITIQASPEQEYEECMVKIGGIQALFTTSDER